MSDTEERKPSVEVSIDKLKATRSGCAGWLTRYLDQYDQLANGTPASVLQAHQKRISGQLNKLQTLHDKYVDMLEEDEHINEAQDWMNNYFERATGCLSDIETKLQSSRHRSVSGSMDSIVAIQSQSVPGEDAASGSASVAATSASSSSSAQSQSADDNSRPGTSQSAESPEVTTQQNVPSNASTAESSVQSTSRDAILQSVSNSASPGLQIPSSSNAGTSSVNVNVTAPGIDDWIDRLVPGVETNTAASSVSTDLTQAIANLEIDRDLPKIELPVFDGSALMWPRFIEQFFVQVHSRRGITDSRRMDLLQSHVKGEAKRLIQGLGYSGRNYALSLQELKFAFGHKVTVARAYINSITSGNVINSGDVQALRSFYIAVRDCITVLQQMNYLGELSSSEVFQRALRRIPNDKRNKWNEYVRAISNTREPTLYDLQAWLKQRVEADISPYAIPFRHHKNSNHSSHPQPHHSTLNSSGTVQPAAADMKSCAACTENHHTSKCRMYLDKSVEARYEFVKEKRLCFNCLYSNHRIGECTSTTSCRVKGCGKRHHTSLHRERQNTTTPAVAHRVNNIQTRRYCVYFQVLPVVVFGSNGRKVKTFALLDSASDISMINSELAKDLGLSGKQSLLTVNTLSSPATMNSTCVNFAVQASDDLDSSPVWINEAWTKQGAFNCPSINASRVKNMSHLRNLHLSNVEASDVKILIGANVPRVHLQLDVRQGGEEEPVAIKTALGWCVMGVTSERSQSSVSACVNLLTCNSDEDDLSRQVERFWQTESFGVSVNLDQSRSVEDQRTLKLMDSKTRFVDGHYEVPMLWKNPDAQLPNNRAMAENRFTSLQRRLSTNPDLKAKYSSTMQGYIEKGYARKMDETEVAQKTNLSWYLPHHNVVNPRKPTKVRVVFDAAAACEGISLNSSLLTGPDLLNSLFGVLQRFRIKPVALVADITDMFYQVKVTEKDSDSLRFLWKDNFDSNSAPDVYKMLVHIFGAKDSPCCANYALRRVAVDGDLGSDLVKETLCKNFYVDDLLKSVDDVQTACKLLCDLRECLSVKGFKLTKWMSSSKEVLMSVPEGDRATPDANLELSDLPVERALGVTWDVQKDAFMFSPTVKEVSPTKRSIVSIVTSIFDPCGFLSPFTFTAKCIIQDLWREKIGWDEVIHDSHLKKWKLWISDLANLDSLRIPRYHGYRSSEDKVELHVFCDASESGFAAFAYLRLIGREIRCSFVAAKCHVAPVKSTMTIPKLELQGAVMAVRLSETLSSELDIELSNIIHWTDAMTVLKYINNESRRWKIFVANRVSEIREKSDPHHWKYVKTTMNPADAATRGVPASDLTIDSMWFRGPQFLWLDEGQWPDQPTIGAPSEDDVNLRKSTHVNVTKAVTDGSTLISLSLDGLINPMQFSSWFELKKRTAWIVRAVKKFGSVLPRLNISVINSSQLTIAELREAELHIIREVQMECFKKDYNDLQSRHELKENSSLRSLCPFFDESDRVIRVGGRLQRSASCFETRHQVLLPYGHHVTKLIAREEHIMNAHAGTEHLVSLLRKRFWPIKCRMIAKQCINSCLHCKRYAVKAAVPLMANLPEDRVISHTKPFEVTGVDYFGPMIVKRARARQKKWGCLFTCLATRAVHLELADSLEADDFILVLRCFIGRRGKPSRIYSDNGKNFVGAERELREALQELDRSNTVHNFLQQSSIEWHFIPPNAPHFGGVWERLVRSTKCALKAVLKEQCVKESVLRTALVEVEDVINSRPLTHNSADVNDFTALTPNHFLRHDTVGNIPPGHFDASEMDSRRRWRQSQVLADHIWKRWLSEYLPGLTVRNKWKKEERNHLVGDLVLLVDENKPRGQWSLGRVLEIHPSEDGRVRSMKIKTSQGTYVRPAAKVCLLEEAT